MSITKAAIGLVYHIHEEKYPRYHFIRNDKSQIMCSVGQALNMMSGYSDSSWDYDEYRECVESASNLKEYSIRTLTKAKRVKKMEYNNLMYQLLASKMPDLAEKFGELVGDKSGPLKKEKNGYFKRGVRWKWEHTSKGEPLGPHGLWMTKGMAKKLGIIASIHISMGKSQRVQVPRSVWPDSWNYGGILK